MAGKRTKGDGKRKREVIMAELLSDVSEYLYDDAPKNLEAKVFLTAYSRYCSRHLLGNVPGASFQENAGGEIDHCENYVLWRPNISVAFHLLSGLTVLSRSRLWMKIRAILVNSR